ncbi:MAG TPA: hypothetical protein VJ643_03520 [Nitrososphaera sp.]|nr:hypothetical protein [Nitrososphaera sp.]
MFPKRKIAIIKTKAAPTGTDPKVKNNVMIANRSKKQEKHAGRYRLIIA